MRRASMPRSRWRTGSRSSCWRRMITPRPSPRFASGAIPPIPINDLRRVSKARRDLAQLELLDLAAGRARKLGHDLYSFGPELLRHPGIAQVSLYDRQIDGASGAGNDERTASLAEPSIREADDGDRGHRRMLIEQVLDLDDRDVLPAPDQNVLHATRNADVAV